MQLDHDSIRALIAQDPLLLAIVNVITYIICMGKIRIQQRINPTILSAIGNSIG
jgi:hypothetical protein